MEPALLAASLGALVGLLLALTGAGGGVLAVPLLVFGLSLPLRQAAPIGLLSVGLAAALGAVLGLRQGIVRYRAAALIGGIGMLLAPLGVSAAQHLPNRPLLAAFALVLAFVAVRTLRGVAEAMSGAAVPCHVDPADHRLTWTRPCARALAGTGALAGLLSGLLGVGGGFVIVPALKRYTELDIRSIQATSLAVIALVSSSGIAAASWVGALPWAVAWPFCGSAVLALALGRRLASRLHSRHLNQAFAWFSLVVATFLLARSLGLG